MATNSSLEISNQITSTSSSTTPKTHSLSPSGSSTSTLKSTTTPRSIFSPRLSSSCSSSSLASYFSCEEEEEDAIHAKKTPAIPCLQCTILGLRCSLSWAPDEDRCGSITCCKRCERGGKSCITQTLGEEYCAGGAGGWEVRRRAEELLAPRRELWKWCLPKIPPGTRAGLRPAWGREWRFDLEDGVETGVE